MVGLWCDQLSHMQGFGDLVVWTFWLGDILKNRNYFICIPMWS